VPLFRHVAISIKWLYCICYYVASSYRQKAAAQRLSLTGGRRHSIRHRVRSSFVLYGGPLPSVIPEDANASQRHVIACDGRTGGHSERQIHTDLCVPFFAEHMRALTEFRLQCI
jgi:hypothetical protein